MIRWGSACLFLCLTLPALAQSVLTVPVTDTSASESPLQITGNITFTDRIAGNSVVSFSNYELTAKNISGKAIVLLVVRFSEAGTRGGGILHTIQRDDFFRDNEIAPEKNFLLDQSHGGIQTHCCINPLDSGKDPVAEVRVIYCEFSDGSTYGERSQAGDILTTRSSILEHLRQLDAANADNAFLRLLAQELKSAEADGFFETLRSLETSQGTKATRSQVHLELGSAERRLTAMRTTAAESE